MTKIVTTTQSLSNVLSDPEEEDHKGPFIGYQDGTFILFMFVPVDRDGIEWPPEILCSDDDWDRFVERCKAFS